MCKNFILQALFQSAQHLYEKREGSGSGFGKPKKHADSEDSDPQHWAVGTTGEVPTTLVEKQGRTEVELGIGQEKIKKTTLCFHSSRWLHT
jgi:hypothetical protein